MRLCTGAQIPYGITADPACQYHNAVPDVVAYSVFFLIAHLVLVVQSRYAQIEKQTGRVVKSGGLLAIYIAFILVSGIMTGAGMDDYWRAAETDGYIGIFALTGIAFVITMLCGRRKRDGRNGFPAISSVS